MWPERLLSTRELDNIEYSHNTAHEVNEPVDHVTCHADGSFQSRRGAAVLCISKMQRVEPLGAGTSTFLRVQILTDFGKHYRVARTKCPSLSVQSLEQIIENAQQLLNQLGEQVGVGRRPRRIMKEAYEPGARRRGPGRPKGTARKRGRQKGFKIAVRSSWR